MLSHAHREHTRLSRKVTWSRNVCVSQAILGTAWQEESMPAAKMKRRRQGQEVVSEPRQQKERQGSLTDSEDSTKYVVSAPRHVDA